MYLSTLNVTDYVIIFYYFILFQDVPRHTVHTLVFRSLKRTHDMFLLNQGTLPPVDPAL